MTNRTLTSLAFRFAGLLLFIKIFDNFGSYFLSMYLIDLTSFFEEQLSKPVNKFYFNGTFLSIANIVVSLFLILRAELISKWAIKTDSQINIDLTKEDLMKSILLVTGAIWLAQSIYLLPDAIDFVIQLTKKLWMNENTDVPKFSSLKYLIKTVLALIFLSRANRITCYLNKKTETSA